MIDKLVVFKYPIPDKSHFLLALPQGAKILTAQKQNGKSQIWALVNPKNETENRNFILVDTGQLFEEKIVSYIKTFQSSNGKQVDHLFEVE